MKDNPKPENTDAGSSPPATMTPARVNELNRKYWEQPGGATFANGKPVDPNEGI